MKPEERDMILEMALDNQIVLEPHENRTGEITLDTLRWILNSLVSEDEEANAPIEFSLPVEIAIAKRLIEEYCEGLPNPLGLPVITHYIHVEDIFAWLDQQE